MGVIAGLIFVIAVLIFLKLKSVTKNTQVKTRYVCVQVESIATIAIHCLISTCLFLFLFRSFFSSLLAFFH